MRLLELFSGTHSIGKVAKEIGIEVISVDRDLDGDCPFKSGYKSDFHIKDDIMTWDYKIYEPGDFDIITASPVCLFWSALRRTWIGRKCKSIHPTEVITKEHIQSEIDLHGKPMVDKVFEIIEYFQPKFWWIENPQTGTMKNYITEKYPEYDTYYDVSYCKYSNYGYEKKTRFWTNIKDFEPLRCNKDCENIVTINKQKLHKIHMGTSKTVEDNGKIIRVNSKALREKYKDYKNLQTGKNHKVGNGKTSRFERYRIPEKLIEELLERCVG